MVMHSLLAHLDQRWFIIWLVKKRTINATETSENMNVSSPPFRSCQSDYP